MVINPGVSVWITEGQLCTSSSTKWMLNGIALDGLYGFGNSDTRSFEGDALLLSPNEKIIQHISLAQGHVAKRGFVWFLRGISCLPNIPFLITSNLSIKIVFDGCVGLDKHADVVDLREGESLTVGTESWFGILTMHTSGKLQLLAVSPDCDVQPQDNEGLWSYEWDYPLGQLIICEKGQP